MPDVVLPHQCAVSSMGMCHVLMSSLYRAIPFSSKRNSGGERVSGMETGVVWKASPAHGEWHAAAVWMRGSVPCQETAGFRLHLPFLRRNALLCPFSSESGSAGIQGQWVCVQQTVSDFRAARVPAARSFTGAPARIPALRGMCYLNLVV